MDEKPVQRKRVVKTESTAVSQRAVEAKEPAEEKRAERQ